MINTIIYLKTKAMDLEQAQKLALETSYAIEAVGEEINTADAAAFFLEGYLYAKKTINKPVYPECGYPTFQHSFEYFRRCEGCDWTSK